jgi:hypothetical protein
MTPTIDRLSTTCLAVASAMMACVSTNAGTESAAHVAAKRFTEEDRQWWAIQPVNRPEVPEISGRDWTRNPIDQFVLEKLSEQDLQPAPEADPYELIRRAYFDLHGLPPTPEQISRFVAQWAKDPDQAWANLIDELLDSPRYGERWGQHWLDVVRYAETDGYRADDFRPNAWRYRDYVVRSINEDKPYDQFVREQLAGDEIAPEDPDTIIGTAFLRHGIYEWNQRNARMHWELIVNEMTSVTSEAFLGLGMGCAQCHDHKFDPILQKDYYALQAFLATTYWPDDRLLASPEEEERYRAELEVWEAKAQPIKDEIDAITRESRLKNNAYAVAQFPPDIQEMYYKPSAERSAYESQMYELVRRQVVTQENRLKFDKELQEEPEKLARYQELRAQLDALEAEKPESPPKAFIATDISPEAVETILKTRHESLAVEPDFLELLGLPKPKIKPTETTTGRRKVLADWIADAGNPLSTRVMANRIWHYHFGSGIVPTPNDFGTLGEDPSHPELLDWLTAEFIDNGWRLKPLHRLVMASATYRQTARREPDTTIATVDPANRLLWRFPPQRLSAEQARDAMLAVSGELDTRLGGPSVDGDAPARGIYVKKRRNRPDKILHNFDSPQGFDSAPQRLQTTTPLQSLLLVNSEWPLQRASAFANRVLAGSPSINESHIEQAFLLAYNRQPTEREIGLAMDFVSNQMGKLEREFTESPPDFEYRESPIAAVTDRFDVPEHSRLLGTGALKLVPDSPYERLVLPTFKLTGDSFTFEAIVSLDEIHEDAKVNTIISQWDGDHEGSGWSIGVTSARSKYDPRNFIVQLIGENGVGNQEYEVVASGLRVPIGKPVYLAAVVTANRIFNESGGGNVVFHMKDLSTTDAEMESVAVKHSIADHIQPMDTSKIIGGRHAKGHTWNGQIARIALSNEPLPVEQLFFRHDETNPERFDLRFSAETEENPLPEGAAWLLPEHLERERDPVFNAMSDFCHALLTSNSFLYLH